MFSKDVREDKIGKYQIEQMNVKFKKVFDQFKSKIEIMINLDEKDVPFIDINPFYNAKMA